MSEDASLIVQSDLTVLADVHAKGFEDARSDLSSFAYLEKSPEHMHSYRIGALSLWNAAVAGYSPDQVLATLARHSRYAVPDAVNRVIRETMGKWGKLKLTALGGDVGPEGPPLLLTCADPVLERELATRKSLEKYLRPVVGGFEVRTVDRGTVKQELARFGWPVADEAPLTEGDPLEVRMRSTALSGAAFSLRPYQRDSVDAFHGGGKPGNGYGVIALPCGSGKTIVGIAAMSETGRKTLVVTANQQAVRQWINELLDKTELDHDSIGEYTGHTKSIKPVTVATYQILTWRPDRNAAFPHFSIFRQEKWGLVIFDEVHLLPAPVFRVVAEIQAVRRLGLTATLVREDGREEDVFTLVGPKRYDVPWKELERAGYIAEAFCREIRIPLRERDAVRYATASAREKIRISSENAEKFEVMRELALHHGGSQVLVIGQYISQLERAAKELDAPIITGKTGEAERSRLYDAFREGAIKVLVVSKVANFAIDLPDASVAIQLSGTFGSRQEEAQRLGRVLRPKDESSFFYTLVSKYTIEEDFATNRRIFLTEQGYRYTIEARELTRAEAADDAEPESPPTGDGTR